MTNDAKYKKLSELITRLEKEYSWDIAGDCNTDEDWFKADQQISNICVDSYIYEFRYIAGFAKKLKKFVTRKRILFVIDKIIELSTELRTAKYS